MNLDDLAQECHQIAVDHGWWENWDRNVLEQVALMHSELSEAVEEIRKVDDPAFIWFSDPFGNRITLEEMQDPTWAVDFPDFKWKPEGFGVELIDAMIRELDTLARYKVPVDFLFRLKTEYNRSRPYKHGNKTA